MKLKRKILIVFLALIFLCFSVVLFYSIFSILKIGISQSNNEETLLEISQSPDGKYVLQAYRTEPGATVDFSVKVYVVVEKEKKLIYNQYHEYEANIVWQTNEIVIINDISINMAEIYKK